MRLSASVPGRRTWLAAALAGAMLLLLAPTARAQEADPELPPALAAAVSAAAAAQAGVPAADVEVLRVEAVTWANGCLGIPTAGACTQALVDGYVVWVVAGGSAHRIHTDMSTNAQVGQAGILISAVATAPLPAGATARVILDGLIEGDIPASGVVMFSVSRGATTAQIWSALGAAGCSADILAKTVGGQWYMYGFTTPAFTNAGFFASDSTLVGGVRANTILLTVCGR
jgi:hypothetical protein